MTDIDRQIAEKVMGWVEPALVLDQKNPDGLMIPPHAKTKHFRSAIAIYPYSTNIQHDYEVLKHCRDTWDDDKLFRLAMELDDLWDKRWIESGFEDRELYADAMPLLYQVGDYSLAALSAIKEKV